MSGNWFDNAVIYGIDVARFQDSDADGFGDFHGLLDRLDYLEQLGVTCLWLLPFYPSDRKDNGYDVTNHIGIDERMGDLDLFRLLVEQAHKRGMHILVDLIIHHTSKKHPWFEAAESDRGSRFHDYYIWRDEQPEHDAPHLSVFPKEEEGIWEASRTGGAFYRHAFYSFEPDLRIANDQVWEEAKAIVDFWIALGADAFRVDAATHLFEDKGVEGASAGLDDRLDDLRRYVDSRNPAVLLLAEADLPRDQLPPYFENRRFNLLYNFLLNNSLFLSLARKSAEPLRNCLEEVLRMDGTWLNFVRNVDELDLERLSDAERDEVLAVFAPEDDMRIYNRGIRRGWPPMMESRDQHRMTMSLLFAFPGIPMLMYGQELGMGDDLGIEGRSSVRLPMQWSADDFGGFTVNPATGIAERSKRNGPFGYLQVNAQAQQGKNDSMWSLVRALIRLRRTRPAIAVSKEPPAEGTSHGVLRLQYGNLVSLHNLSDSSQPVGSLDGYHQVLGERYEGTELGAFGFAWLEKSEP